MNICIDDDAEVKRRGKLTALLQVAVVVTSGGDNSSVFSLCVSTSQEYW